MTDTGSSTPDTTSDAAIDLGELTRTRIYEAPRELVFRCMITPEHLTHFWGPTGISTPVENITVDPRPGGVFETIMVNDADGTEYPSRGVFVEVTGPERLVWTEPDVEGGMTTSLTFTDLGDGRTAVASHETSVPAMYRSDQAQAGMQSSFDRFAAHLKSIATVACGMRPPRAWSSGRSELLAAGADAVLDTLLEFREWFADFAAARQ